MRDCTCKHCESPEHSPYEPGGPLNPAKPTAIEINYCAERLIGDSHRFSWRRWAMACHHIEQAQQAAAKTTPEHAFRHALLAMRYNPRAFALAGLIGQHCHD